MKCAFFPRLTLISPVFLAALAAFSGSIGVVHAQENPENSPARPADFTANPEKQAEAAENDPLRRGWGWGHGHRHDGPRMPRELRHEVRAAMAEAEKVPEIAESLAAVDALHERFRALFREELERQEMLADWEKVEAWRKERWRQRRERREQREQNPQAHPGEDADQQADPGGSPPENPRQAGDGGQHRHQGHGGREAHGDGHRDGDGRHGAEPRGDGRRRHPEVPGVSRERLEQLQAVLRSTAQTPEATALRAEIKQAMDAHRERVRAWLEQHRPELHQRLEEFRAKGDEERQPGQSSQPGQPEREAE